jgi:hypothetical protein
MARLSPESYRPILSFRFKIQFSAIPNINFFGKATSLPSLSNNPKTIDYGNTYITVKGKTKWNNISIDMYAFEGMTHDELFGYLNDMHQEISSGKDKYGSSYKKDVQIQLLGPDDSVVGTFKLIGAFIETLNFGQMDWSNDDPIVPQITLIYDYAEYN